MSLNGLVSAIVAILSVSIALVLSPSNIASLGTSLEIDTTASVVREKCLGFSLQEQWTNKSSANISVSILTTHTRVYDARTLRKGDEIQIRNYFGSDHAAVQENSDNTFAPLGTKLGTTAAHTWEFLSIRKGTATRPVQRET